MAGLDSRVCMAGLVQGEDYIQVNRLKPRTPIFAYTEHSQFIDVSEVNNGIVQQAQ